MAYSPEAQRRYDAKVRAAVLARYAKDPERPACVCCGSTWRLCLDHLDAGRGNQERRATMGRGHRAGIPFHRWLYRQGLPDGYRLLCEFCNSERRDREECPHATTLTHVWDRKADEVEFWAA